MPTASEPSLDPDPQGSEFDLDSFSNLPRKRRGRPVLLLGILLLFGMLCGAGWLASRSASSNLRIAETHLYTVQPRDFTVVLEAVGELKAAESRDVKNNVYGRSTIVYLVPEGTYVEEGDVIAEVESGWIDDWLLREALNETRALNELEAAQRDLQIQLERNESDLRKGDLQITLKGLELERYLQGQWQEDMRQAEIRIEQAQINLERKAEEYAAAQKMMEEGFLTRNRFERMEFDHRRAEWELQKAVLAQKVLNDYTHKMELLRRESDLSEATKDFDHWITKNAAAEAFKKQATLAAKQRKLLLIRGKLVAVRKQRQECTILSPVSGMVVYGKSKGKKWWDRSGEVRQGATVHQKQVLVTIPDTSEMLVVARIHEARMHDLKLDQRVVVTVEDLPGQTFYGRVSRIAPLPNSRSKWFSPRNKEYEAEILLDEANEDFKLGATATAEIFVRDVKNVPAIPLHTVFTKGRQKFVFLMTPHGEEPVEVQLGRSNDIWVEVVDGLEEGDQILLAVTADQQRLLPDPILAPQQVEGSGSADLAQPLSATSTADSEIQP